MDPPNPANHSIYNKTKQKNQIKLIILYPQTQERKEDERVHVKEPRKGEPKSLIFTGKL